ncbi:MAG: L,D-transpeptidase family protein [Phenylobacterium sp.]
MVLVLLCGLAVPAAAPVGSPALFSPLAPELSAALAHEPADAAAAVYRSQAYRPIWVRGWTLRPEAERFAAVLETAADDGLDPERYGPARLKALIATARRTGAPADVVRAELALSGALAAYGSDLHTPLRAADITFTDPAVARPSYAPRAVLAFAAGAPDLGAAIAEIRRMSPPYVALRQALAAARAAGAPLARRQLILANLERARALPADLGRRYLLVDVAAQELRLYDDDRVVDSMPVVVGKLSEPTPSMAGLIRYAVLRPYWNVPPDLVRNTVAPAVLRQGVSYLTGQNMEVLSDWSPQAVALDPTQVDWAAVAAGDVALRVRQRPGGQNMMGKVKFIFPNPLGVYLHDTPLKALFAGARRTESAGCVRLADAPRLARWLAPDAARRLDEPGEPETRVDLPTPIPVYLVYFTVAPSPDGQAVVTRKDIYGRDAVLTAGLRDRQPTRAAA